MKKIQLVLIVTLIFSLNGHCQSGERNLLSIDKFYNQILADGVAISNIIDTNIDQGSIQSLFSATVIYERASVPFEDFFNYKISGLEFHYEMTEKDNRNSANLDMIKIKSPSKVGVLGKEIGIGDHISILGNVEHFSDDTILFSNYETGSDLSIDHQNSIITKIEFNFYGGGELTCDKDGDKDGVMDCNDKCLNEKGIGTSDGCPVQNITTPFTIDKGGWINNGSVTTTLENGRLKVSGVNSPWEGIRRPLDELDIAPGKKLNISLDFDKATTNAAVRFYVQELKADGSHLSWNVFNGNAQTGIHNYVYTIKAGYKAILRIDKSNTHLDESTEFYVDDVIVSLADCSKDSDGDGLNDCEDGCPDEAGPSPGEPGFNNGCPYEVQNPGGHGNVGPRGGWGN